MFLAIPDADAGAIVKAMCQYTTTGAPGDVTPLQSGILAMLIAGFEEDKQKYIDTCERNRRNIEARWNKKSDTTVYDRIRPYTTEYETIPNYTDKDMEKDKELEKDTEKDLEKDKEKEEAEASKKELLKTVMNAWNGFEDRGDIPTVKTIPAESKRGKAILARVSDYGIETVLNVIDAVSRSDFLKGRNDKKWSATCDWVFLPNNFIKVMEGNYRNRNSGGSHAQADFLAEWLNEREGTNGTN